MSRNHRVITPLVPLPPTLSVNNQLYSFFDVAAVTATVATTFPTKSSSDFVAVAFHLSYLRKCILFTRHCHEAVITDVDVDDHDDDHYQMSNEIQHMIPLV